MLDAFKKGEKPKPGPQSGRHTSENSAGLTALTSKVRIQLVSICTKSLYSFVCYSVVAVRPRRVLHRGIPIGICFL